MLMTNAQTNEQVCEQRAGERRRGGVARARLCACEASADSARVRVCLCYEIARSGASEAQQESASSGLIHIYF